MQITPYLYFDGRCADAFSRYAAILGGAPTLMPYGDDTACVESAAHDPARIMHAHLAVADHALMGSDVPPGMPLPDAPHTFVSLDVDSDAEAERIFDALAEDGEIRVPMAESFFAHRFGMLVDRYGTGWMVLRARAC
ncbi:MULTISPECIES: VOC family protein [Luteimonas]|uniref:VOC family protein n=1 Tax=Luteimonas TaxID=83614 RepID=UPI000C7DCE10|nr:MULTISPECIES: VOC family protein [Luteimonas]